MYKARVAETEAEVDSAYELFYRSFGSNNYEVRDIFDITRENDPTMKPENLFIAEDKGKSVVAALRTVTRDLTLFGQEFKIGGIATTAVHTEHQGKGLFNLLTQFTLKEMINRKLSLCLEFARRAIDYINIPHGFWGTPVERRYTILDPPKLEAGLLKYRKIGIEDVPFLEEAYRHVYRRLSVFLDRPQSLWQTKMKLPAFSREYDAYICSEWGSDEPVGYVIGQHGKGIIDICSTGDNPETYQSILFSEDSPLLDAAQVGINLSTEHPAINAFRGYAYSIFTRHPHYGGNILQVLDPYSKESRIMQLVKSQLASRGVEIPSNISDFPHHVVSRVITAAMFGYEVTETRQVLEIPEGAPWDSLRPTDFIFTPLDDF